MSDNQSIESRSGSNAHCAGVPCSASVISDRLIDLGHWVRRAFAPDVNAGRMFCCDSMEAQLAIKRRLRETLADLEKLSEPNNKLSNSGT